MSLLSPLLPPSLGRWLLAVSIGLSPIAQAENTLDLGVYSYRDNDLVQQQYQALTRYLDDALPEHSVRLHILNGDALQNAMLNNELDMLLLNPSLFEVIRHEHSLTGAIATVERLRNGVATSSLGGVIVTLSNQTAYRTLADLQHAKIAIPGRTNAGAYAAPLFEIKQAGVATHAIQFIETGSNDAVLEAVLAGKAPVGFVRTGLLESWIEAGKLDPKNIHIINRQPLSSYPYAVSTKLYPEWPFVVLAHVPTDIQRRLIAALFELPADSPAAQQAGIAGFVPPMNYLPLQKVLKELRIYPYDIPPDLSLLEIAEQYKVSASALGLTLLGLLLTLAWIARLSVKQKRALLTIQKQEQTLQQVIQGTQAGTWEWQIQTGRVSFNERWAQMLGYTLAELEPITIDTWSNLTHPDDLAQSEGLLKAHFRGETDAYQCEVRMRHKDGHWVWVYDSGKLWKRAPNGAPLVMSGTHVDITHIKENELRLQATAKRDALMLKLPLLADELSEEELIQTTLAEIEALTQSQISFVHLIHNEQEIELLAWSKDTLDHYCHAHYERHYPVNQAGVWADTVRTRQPVIINDYPNYPAKHGMPQGHAPLQRFCSVPVMEKGEVVMLTGIGNKAFDYDALDVETLQLVSNTLWRLIQRKKTQQRLTQAASVFNTAQEGILITDVQGHILDVNHAFTQITGYERDEVLGQTPHLLSSGRHDAAFYQALWSELTAKGQWSGEIWNRRKNDEIYPQRITISATRNGHGEIQQYVALLSDVTAEKSHLKQLEYLASHDKLTGLPNRALLSDRINQAILRSERSQTLLAAVFIDLDGFKPVNDRYGHDAGDAILKTLAQRFQECLRQEDTIARIGGDEFVGLVIDLKETDELIPVLERLQQAAAEPVLFHNNTLQVTASIGAFIYTKPKYSTETLDADQLLREADQAMYQAKQLGKNRFVIHQNSAPETPYT